MVNPYPLNSNEYLGEIGELLRLFVPFCGRTDTLFQPWESMRLLELRGVIE